MNLIVLIDLDDTLLVNSFDAFLPAYLKLLSKSVDSVPRELLIDQLLSGTKKMVAKDMPDQTLEQVFDQVFYPGIGVSKQSIRDKIDHFYKEIFSSLKSLTKPNPGAVQLIDTILQNGHMIIIATNPLFPRRAILHRLDWANLPVGKYPFSLVTSYESFHFCKPNPAYYAEILAQMGWINLPAVMIGNSREDDILPASQLGLPTFWLTNNGSHDPVENYPLNQHGKINEIIPWLNKVSAANIEIGFNTMEAVLAILKSTPAALDTLGANMTSETWSRHPLPEEWSPAEVIYHLRDVDQDITLPRITKILNEKDAFIPAVATTKWAKERKYDREDGKKVLSDFITVRTNLLTLLNNLTPQDWQRSLRHEKIGETTLLGLLNKTVRHDQEHIRQFHAAR